MRIARMIATGLLGGGKPLLPYSVDFSTLADGALPEKFTGATWAVSSSKAVNTPTMGDNLFDAGKGTFDTTTESWAALGGNAIACDSGELKVTYVDNASGAIVYFSDAADLSEDLEVGQYYRIEYDARVSAGGSVSVVVGSGSLFFGSDGSLTNTTAQTFSITFYCGHATTSSMSFGSMGAGESIWIDNLKIYKLTFASLFSSISYQLPSTFVIRAAVTSLPASAQAGVWFGDGISPTNFVWAFYERSRITLNKKVGATKTIIQTTTVTHVEGAYVEIRRTAEETFQVWYNGAQVGTDQTISDTAILASSFYGMISTKPQCTFTGFAVGTDLTGRNFKVSTLGDSIAAATGGWPGSVTTGIGIYFNTLHNVAVSGNSIATHMDAQTVACASDDADIIIIALGTNDNPANAVAIQAEAEENILELQGSNANAIVYWLNILPEWTDVGGGTPIDNSVLRSAIAAACAAQGITCWDTYTDPWISASDTTDGTHPTAGGHAKIASRVLALLPAQFAKTIL